MLYYLPGCDVNKNHPIAGAKLRRYLLARGDIAEATCCRKDIGMLEAGDTVIQNCTLCQLMLAERVPEVRVVSLYEYLLADEAFPWPDFSDRTLTLQDCYRTRHDARLHAAVRRCLDCMRVSYVEMPEHHGNTRFCGVWLMGPAAPDCLELAPHTFAELDRMRESLEPKEQEARMHAWAKECPTDEIAVYCNGCERGVSLGGKTPVHLIELLAAGL